MTSVESHSSGLPVYLLYEMQQAGLEGLRLAAAATRLAVCSAPQPLSETPLARSIAAGCELFEHASRRHAKPEWRIGATSEGGTSIGIEQEVVWTRPFCRLVHFARSGAKRELPRVLLVAPMSGHHATLLRGTVATLLPDHDVYVTDWVDARTVPVAEGRFDLDDYIDYLIAMLELLQADTHVVAVCQAAVPALAAVALMEAGGNPHAPRSMVLLGGPIDPRASPTVVTRLAERRGIEWFRRHAIHTVPLPHAGALRTVYPGFLQLGGFMSMHLDRHVTAYRDMFLHLVQGDGDSALRHRQFYDEYLAVMDLTAEFYLQTVESVFIEHALAKGTLRHRGIAVEPSRVRRCALMTIEGELDDITGRGQTAAAHRLCARIPRDRRAHHLQAGVGHYGVFNGSRFRGEIAPRIAGFIRAAAAGKPRRAWSGAIVLRPGLLRALHVRRAPIAPAGVQAVAPTPRNDAQHAG